MTPLRLPLSATRGKRAPCYVVRMPLHREDGEFILRFELTASFPEDYDGELDGHVWAREFEGIAAEIVAAAARLVAQRPGWTVRGGNRGRSSLDEVTRVAERRC
jgi:hypothetical protein